MQLLNTVLFTNITEGSIWIVAQQTASPPNFINGGAFYGVTQTAGPFMVLYSERIPSFGNDIIFYDQFNGKTQVFIPQDNQPHYLGVNKNPLSIDYYADSDSALANKAVSENWNVYINYFLGDQVGNGAGTMIGNICEFIVYNAELTPSEITELTTYFNDKYGI